MKCKIKRGDREGLVEIKGKVRRYRTFRIRIVYRWMGYLREVDYTETKQVQQVQQESRIDRQVQSIVLIELLVEVDRVGEIEIKGRNVNRQKYICVERIYRTYI